MHSKGLKFGLYIDLGNETCGGFPGSLGHYARDSATLSEWGVDFVKAGACGIKDVQSCNDGKHYIASVSSTPCIYQSGTPKAHMASLNMPLIDVDIIAHIDRIFDTRQ